MSTKRKAGAPMSSGAVRSQPTTLPHSNTSFDEQMKGARASSAAASAETAIAAKPIASVSKRAQSIMFSLPT
jgi:hypothetical protein